MKLFIIGSIKIDSKFRKKLFLYNLDSLKPIASVLAWNFNITGKYAEFCRDEIIRRYSRAKITKDDDSSLYKIVKAQLSAVEEPMVFFWQEDHWFICPHKNLFFYLLDKFEKSKAEVLSVTHLVQAWEHKHIHKLITDKSLYKEYLVNLTSQKELWKIYSWSYLASIPGIYKKGIALEILEINKPVTDNSKKPGGYELYGERAKLFLAKRSFIEMVPTFHVLREVFRFNQEQRAMNMKQALQIIRLRENQERLQYFGIWTKIINMILTPRMVAGRIKRRILK